MPTTLSSLPTSQNYQHFSLIQSVMPTDNLRTLAICSTHRPHLIPDLIENFLYVCGPESYLILIDETGRSTETQQSQFTICRETNYVSDPHRGFKQLAALGRAVRSGISFDLAMLWADDVLLLRPGIDVWAAAQLRANLAGILGVASESTYSGWFMKCASHFERWRLPYATHDNGDRPVQDELCFLTWELVQALFERNLLPPPEWALWPLSAGTCLSWASQMLGYSQIAWGRQDRPALPLLVDASPTTRLTTPTLLSPELYAFGSVRRVRGYDEQELRDWAAAIRRAP